MFKFLEKKREDIASIFRTRY